MSKHESPSPSRYCVVRVTGPEPEVSAFAAHVKVVIPTAVEHAHSYSLEWGSAWITLVPSFPSMDGTAFRDLLSAYSVLCPGFNYSVRVVTTKKLNEKTPSGEKPRKRA